MFSQVNQTRANAGVAPLKQGNSSVQAYADIRAKELLQNFSHTRPNGQSALTELKSRAGSSFSGENVSSGSIYYTPAERNASLASSSGHYANMVDPNFNYMTISVYTVGTDVYIVELFYR